MATELRILLLEDTEADAELVERELRKSELQFSLRLARNRQDFLTALKEFDPGLVLADYSLPSFDAMSALQMARELRPDVPCIIVSGTVGEEVAIDTLKKGATDYVLKGRISRLVPAVKRALQESRQRAELRQSAEQVREQAKLLDLARDAIIQMSMEDRILYWNRGASRLYGWAQAEAIGKILSELLFSSRDEFTRVRAAVLEKDEWTGEMRQNARDRKDLIVESRWTLIRDPAGQPKSILMVNTDITERKRIESQLLRAQRMESIGMLAGGIAHDLNNILAPILMASEALARKITDPESLKMISTIESSAARGADIVKHVLMFARGVEGVHQVIDPADFMIDIQKILQETFPKSLNIVCEVPQALPALYGDVTQFQQVLLNLCVNARDAMPAGGTLTIRAQSVELEASRIPAGSGCRPGPYIEISVTDTGEGIAPENLKRIFEPFFTTKAAGRGTGLGLSMVHTIVRSHGGFILVDSKLQEGTTFRIFLPAFESFEPRRSHKVQETLPAGHGECVLVVDDEASIREMTKETLDTFGYNVLTAKDGAEARTIFEESKDKVDAVLVDMIMPVMEGPQCMHALREIKPEVKIILTSGLDEHQELCDGDDACTFLAKPYTADQLLSTLHNVLTEAH